MKALLVLALSSLSAIALADAATPEKAEQRPVQYNYSMHLDIAKVIATTPVPNNICGVVPARMTYEDSAGQRHILEYRVMGNGCSNG